jgi:hypothetical protein
MRIWCLPYLLFYDKILEPIIAFGEAKNNATLQCSFLPLYVNFRQKYTLRYLPPLMICDREFNVILFIVLYKWDPASQITLASYDQKRNIY